MITTVFTARKMLKVKGITEVLSTDIKTFYFPLSRRRVSFEGAFLRDKCVIRCGKFGIFITLLYTAHCGILYEGTTGFRRCNEINQCCAIRSTRQRERYALQVAGLWPCSGRDRHN